MPEADKSTPRFYTRKGENGMWWVWVTAADGDVPMCCTYPPEAELVADRIALALDRDAAFDALVAALKRQRAFLVAIGRIERAAFGDGRGNVTLDAEIAVIDAALKLAEVS